MVRGSTIFCALWLFIILVSVWDGILVVEYRSFIMLGEMNPMGRGLLILNGGQIWYLLGVKFIGTGAACGLLLLIHQLHRPLGTLIASGVAAFQLGLLLFLSLA